MSLSRRQFMQTSLVTAAGLSAGLSSYALNATPSTKRTLCLFTKCLQFLCNEDLGKVLAQIGFEGADIPVRENGYIQPNQVKTELPKTVKALSSFGLQMPMITTNITDAKDKETEYILGTASHLGIKYYRMGWLNYDHSLSIPKNLDIYKHRFEKLEKINRKYDIQGCYQNHSGQFVGAPVWDLYELVKDCDPKHIGIQYDIRHATTESGYSWNLGMKLISKWISTIVIKDFIWTKVDGKLRHKSTPLGDGMVNFNKFCREYSKLNINAPVSVHCEYDLGGAEYGSKNPKMEKDEIYKFLKKDLDWLKGKLNQSNI